MVNGAARRKGSGLLLKGLLLKDLLQKSLLLKGSLLFSVLLLVLASSDIGTQKWTWQDLFLTRDQQGRILFYRKQYRQAASRFEDRHWRALSFYTAQDFHRAAELWTELPGAEALFNRGNALAHRTDYQGAADSYQLALQLRPNWPEAQANLQLVQALGKQAKTLDEYVAQSQGEMPADDFTFDKGSKRMDNALPQTDAEASELTASKEIQALWMQRLHATPADFLRLKFRYQDEQRQQP